MLCYAASPISPLQSCDASHLSLLSASLFLLLSPPYLYTQSLNIIVGGSVCVCVCECVYVLLH